MIFQQETIVMALEGGTPVAIVRPNGTVKYYKLTEMNFQDHIEFLGADNVQPQK